MSRAWRFFSISNVVIGRNPLFPVSLRGVESLFCFVRHHQNLLHLHSLRSASHLTLFVLFVRFDFAGSAGSDSRRFHMYFSSAILLEFSLRVGGESLPALPAKTRHRLVLLWASRFFSRRKFSTPKQVSTRLSSALPRRIPKLFGFSLMAIWRASGRVSFRVFSPFSSQPPATSPPSIAAVIVRTTAANGTHCSPIV